MYCTFPQQAVVKYYLEVVLRKIKTIKGTENSTQLKDFNEKETARHQ